ncbi:MULTISPECIES: NAD-dependent epimerase/dehydratase family protein [unclassified Paenibacillus]|uniref:NAD-dependent epimerase/dehydratase family protein n=1 Tax=unclassified Paenibacillus TaxID=185978 RepID=UPI002474C035|nr:MULTISPECIES: NAD-dependent epimerase/dehydratase family protein [unclassified Paenibacillus]MDH6430802.1 GDP-4-dehydro-6-deoxy-D-mannose reductase [Paenibacillus sp. PastH-4]MDH6446762.1 GDP-4-dehydro-6-deoxy-D-mannose reductase [Paenibacillus sp. PastF-4]MDH6531154.1 GDP-4-dehydro-6-deoxy-D-mannose reductase [Paenibacillus sp. PastH-3]
MTGQRLLITGAGGFTGQHAVRLFSAGGAEVIAVLRPQSTAASTLFPEGVKIYICDLSDRKAVAEMIKQTTPDAVLHLAGKNSVPESWLNPLLYMETNVMATLYLLEAMRSLPSSRILVAGSRLKFKPGVVAGPPHPYSLSKTIEELVSLAWGTLFKQPVLLAEPCNLIGPGPSTGFCSLLAQHIVRSEGQPEEEIPPFKLSSRYALRDFLDVRDAVRAYDYILRKGTNGTIYRIDSGKQRELGEIAEQLLSHSVGPVPMDWGPADAERAISEIAATADKQVHSEASTPEADVTSLGWLPEIGLNQSLMDILNYYRVSGEGKSL